MEDAYCQIDFTVTAVNRAKRSQCILWNVVFCNSNLKPYFKACEYFKSKHGGFENGHNAKTLKIQQACYDKTKTLTKAQFTNVEKSNFSASHTQQHLSLDLLLVFFEYICITFYRN